MPPIRVEVRIGRQYRGDYLFAQEPRRGDYIDFVNESGRWQIVTVCHRIPALTEPDRKQPPANIYVDVEARR